jgi:hypothetical protein
MDQLKAKIQNIGNELVGCQDTCAGIQRDQQRGSLPRCLVLELAGRNGNRGCAAIGINPGRAKEPEEAFYRRKGPTYEAVLEYWNLKITQLPYYARFRSLLDQVGLTGPVLWTELAKCQNPPGTSVLPPLATLRTCTGRFLSRELAVLPAGWPLVAIGGEAFKALAYLYPKRTVIGVPHPTGSYGHFPRLMPGGTVLPNVKNQVQVVLEKPAGELLWLEG